MSEDKEYKLTYFDIRGRAEVIRLMFAMAKLPFIDDRINKTEGNWDQLKNKTPWGQLPVLELENGKQIAQTMSILRFVAKKCDLYSQDHFQAAKIDELAYAIAELAGEWFNFLFSRDASEKGVQKEALISTHFPKYFEKLSKIHLENGGPYMIGEKLAFPDILLADLIDSVDTAMDEGVVDQYPIMRSLKDSIWENPSLQDYLLQRK